MPCRPLVLIIRDGWGQNPHPEHASFNAIALAKTPVDDRLHAEWPSTLIRTSGTDVGLPEGTMGNSEVGHQNIGAGRIVDQDSVRISKACAQGELKDIPALRESIEGARARGRAVHLMGIASDAGVHGLLEHLYALLSLCKSLGQEKVAIHLFTDGRDTGPFTGKGYIEQIEAHCRDLRVGRVVSVIGRYYAMDRDNRWERVERAWRCLTGRDYQEAGIELVSSATEAVQRFYDNPTSETMRGDEFVLPTIIAGSHDSAKQTRINDGDAVIYYNYRGDRPRQLVSAFVLPEFQGHVKPSPDTGEPGFDRGAKLDLDFVMMSPYSEELARHARVAFPKPPKLEAICGAHLSSLGLTQFRCAETEKFPHVTFFFNDYRDEAFPGEHREIIQSPRVATYDLQPEMSADGVRDAVLRRLEADDCEDMLIVNFANPDMVGHTGDIDAAVKACEVVDVCVGTILDKTLSKGGGLIITADHGNAEQMRDPESGRPHTAHTTYDVPLFVVGEGLQGKQLRRGGRLADIVPTALEMLGVEQPKAMTGRSLLAEG